MDKQCCFSCIYHRKKKKSILETSGYWHYINVVVVRNGLFNIDNLVILPLVLLMIAGAAETKVSEVIDLENFLLNAEPCLMSQR